MKFGFCTGTENYHRLIGIGYDFIELDGTDIYKMTDEEFFKCKHIIDSGPLKCENLNEFILPQAKSLGEDVYDKEPKDYINKIIRRAHLLRVKTIYFESILPKAMSLKSSKEKPLQQCWDQVEMAVEIAAPYGIRILIGVSDKHETSYINNIKEAHDFIRDFKQENIGLVLDLYHFWHTGDELDSLDSEIIKHIEHLYIADEDERAALKESRLEKYEEYIKHILKLGYKGNLSYRGKIKNFESEAKETLRLLKRII